MRALSTVVAAALMLLVATSAGSQQLLLRTYQFDPLQGEPWIAPELRAAEPRPGETGYYLVQLTGPVYKHQKTALRAAGAELWDYIPEYAFITRMTPEDGQAVRSLDFVRWVGLYHPAYKLDPAIGTHTFTQADRIADPWLRLVISIHYPEDVYRMAETLASAGGEVLEIAPTGSKHVLVRVPPYLTEQIAREEGVLYVLEQGEVGLCNNTTCWVVQTNQNGNESVWAQGIHGEGQIVAEMDTGVRHTSCYFSDPEGDPFGNNHRKIQDYSLYGNGVGGGTQDDHSHGTHVGGTVCGDDDSGTYDQYNGSAYNARLVVQDCDTGGSFGTPSNMIPALQDAYNAGARFHTNSWGYYGDDSYSAQAQDIDEFMWDNPDFLVLVAIGNEGGGGMRSPSTAKNCVTVGGTDRGTSAHNMYGNSSCGPTDDGRRKPTVIAPAMNILSASNSSSCYYSSKTGTSMATPAMAACAALVRQYYMDGFHPTGAANAGDAFTPSAALIKATLVASGEPMTGSGVTGYPDNWQGWGRVLLENALYFSGDDTGLDVYEHSGIGTGQIYSQSFYLGTKPARFVLVWTDPEASLSANPALINNLNLRVTDPAGRAQYWGNNFSGGQSVPGGSADGVNVVEVVHVNNPASQGWWTVEVIGQNVPTGPQPFAVTVRGSGLNIPVDLGSFNGSHVPDRGGVLLEWRTESERDNLGFFVLRSDALGGDYRRINESIIEGAGTTALPTSYSYVDGVSEPGVFYYKLQQVDSDGAARTYGPIAVSLGQPVPERFGLGPAVPNPSDGAMALSFSIPQRTSVRLAVYDVTGRLVNVLLDDDQQAASHRILWDGKDMAGTRVSAGRYVFRLEGDDYVGTLPVVILE
jgi:hypothetical protein